MSDLNPLWFWLFPLMFAVHDLEEAAFVWLKERSSGAGSAARPGARQMLVLTGLELAILMAASALAAAPGASPVAVFAYAVLLGGYTAHGFVHLYRGWRARRYTVGEATAMPLVVIGGLFIFAKLVEAEYLSWGAAAASLVLGALLIAPLKQTARWARLA